MIEIIGHTEHSMPKMHSVHGYEQSNQGQGNGNTKRLVRQVPQAKRHHVHAESGIYKPKDHLCTTKYPAKRTHTAGYLTINPLEPQPVSLSMLSLSDASEDWVSAIQEALDHLLLVIKNNPTKQMTDILSRPDVQQALTVAGQNGAQAVISAIRQDWEDAGAPMNSEYLASVLRDMLRNGSTFPARMTSALSESGPQEAQRVVLTDRLRAAAAQASAQTRAQTEAALLEMLRQGVHRVQWKAHIDERTCSGCRAMNGKMQFIGAEFDRKILTDNGIKVYGSLIGPPAHPHCRCELEPA